jgi:hypothetical protein
MGRTCREEKENKSDHWPYQARQHNASSRLYAMRWAAAKLISLNVLWSHGKYFIVMSHSSHVTIKWAGRAATLPTLKGGRNHGRIKLLTGKIREDHAF